MIKTSILPSANCRFKATSIKIPRSFCFFFNLVLEMEQATWGRTGKKKKKNIHVCKRHGWVTFLDIFWLFPQRH